MCHGHRRQKENKIPLKPLILRTPSTTRDPQGRKKCSKCKEWKSEEVFGPGVNTLDKLASNCYTCDRDVNLRRYYNISLQEYNRMLEDQQGRCLCGTTPMENGHALHVDHDHSCCPTKGTSCGKCIRGLLCSACNTALGLLKDNPERLRLLIYYLEAH